MSSVDVKKCHVLFLLSLSTEKKQHTIPASSQVNRIRDLERQQLFPLFGSSIEKENYLFYLFRYTYRFIDSDLTLICFAKKSSRNMNALIDFRKRASAKNEDYASQFTFYLSSACTHIESIVNKQPQLMPHCWNHSPGLLTISPHMLYAHKRCLSLDSTRMTSSASVLRA